MDNGVRATGERGVCDALKVLRGARPISRPYLLAQARSYVSMGLFLIAYVAGSNFVLTVGGQ